MSLWWEGIYKIVTIKRKWLTWYMKNVKKAKMERFISIPYRTFAFMNVAVLYRCKCACLSLEQRVTSWAVSTGRRRRSPSGSRPLRTAWQSSSPGMGFIPIKWYMFKDKIVVFFTQRSFWQFSSKKWEEKKIYTICFLYS